jgi:hypothetical protein
MTGCEEEQFAIGFSGTGVEGICTNGSVVADPPYLGYVMMYPTGRTQ